MAGLRILPEIVPLSLATVQLPASHPAASLGRTVPVYGFCIRHPDGAILVDTGVGMGNAFIDEAYAPETEALEIALRPAGVALDDVVMVINSHLHFDHCGQNPTFFGSETSFVAQAAELRTVRADPLYTDHAWAIAPTSQQRVVDGDELVADGVRLLATPGHTAGHQSVVVEADGRRLVIGAQVVWHAAEYSQGVAAPANVDPVPELQAAAVASIERIKALKPEVVYFSHCDALSLNPES